jgi:zinc protease
MFNKITYLIRIYSLFLYVVFNLTKGNLMKYLTSFLITFLMVAVNTNLFAISIQDSTTTASKDSIDPKIVIEKYVEAIGGKDALAKVEDRTTIMRGTAMGQPITMIVKQKIPNKLRQEIKAGAMDQVVIFDGEKGVMNVMNQKIDVKDKELEALKLEANMDFMTDPEKFGIKLFYDGTEKFNGKDVYKIKMVLPDALVWYAYFYKDSGLRAKDEREMETARGVVSQTTIYDDYKEVDGVKYPFKITQTVAGQSIDITISSIKVNKGLTDDLFTIPE